MCISLVFTNIIKYGVTNLRVNEGFEDSDETELATEKDDSQKLDKSKISDDKKSESDKPVVNKKGTKEDLKKEYPEFKEIKTQLLKGMSEMNPLLDKAESFVEKYSHLVKT